MAETPRAAPRSSASRDVRQSLPLREPVRHYSDGGRRCAIQHYMGVEDMADSSLESRSTRPTVRVLLPLAEVAAVVSLFATLFMPWFHFSNGDIIAVPPGSSRYLDILGYEWHPSGMLNASALLTLAGLYVSGAAVVARIILRRRWPKVILLLGFLAAFLGSIQTFDQTEDVRPVPGSTTTTAIGLWLFTGVAASGLVVAGIDLAAKSGGAPSRRAKSSHSASSE